MKTTLKTLAIAAALVATLVPAKALEVGETFQTTPETSQKQNWVWACKTLEEIRTGNLTKCGTILSQSHMEVLRKSGDAVCVKSPNSKDNACSWAVIPNAAIAQKAPSLPAVDTREADANPTTRQVINMYRGPDGPAKLGATAYALGLGLGYLRASIMAEKTKGEGLFCAPPKLTMNAALVVSTLESFVRAVPFAANEDASLTLGFALAETFPCKKGSQSPAGSLVKCPTFGSSGLMSAAKRVADGSSSRNRPSRLLPVSELMAPTPVTLPPGRLRLVTKPSSTGSPPVRNTIGIVVVAALAANTDAAVPGATTTATRR